MNARIFKKNCKQARAKLIAEHGFSAEQFVGSDAGEEHGYLFRFVKKFPRHQRFQFKHDSANGYIRMAKRTPMHWWYCSYSGDGDAEPALDTLNNVEFYNSPKSKELMEAV